MLAYPRSVILDNTNNYGILKTETYFGFTPPVHKEYLNERDNATEQMKWILAPMKTERMGRSLAETPHSIDPEDKPSGREKKHKCIFKVFKKYDKSKRQRHRHRRRRRKIRAGKMGKMGKKYMMPVILGLLAAKSVLVPIALKALAFMSAKGLMMGFFSTVMASVLSLKGMFENQNRHNDRKDEKTQVEVIQIPSKHENDHHYYSEVHEPYRRYDMVPVVEAL